MAIPWREVVAARARCSVHVQLRVERVEPPDAWPGEARAHGRVERVFRGDAVPVGGRLTIPLGCRRGADEPLDDDVVYVWERLAAAAVIEACLERRDGSWRPPTNSCTELLTQLTDEPRLELTHPPDLPRASGPLARIWRFFAG